MAERTHRLVTGSFPVLERWLSADIAARLGANGASNQVTLLTGAGLAGRRLQASLAQSGIPAGRLRRKSPDEFARDLRGGDAAVLDLPPGGAQILFRTATRATSPTSYFAPALDQDGLRDALLNTLDELALAFPGGSETTAGALRTAAGTLDDSSGKLAGLAGMFASYRAAMAGHYSDHAARLAAAIAAVEGGAALLPDHCYVYALFDLATLERNLLAAYARNCDLTVLLPHDGSDACRRLNEVRDFFADMLGCVPLALPDEQPATNLGRVRAAWFLPTPSTASPSPAPLERGPGGEANGDSSFAILAAPGEARETREAVREVVRAALAGVPLHETAILFRDAGRYRLLAHELLSAAGILHYLPGGIGLAQTPAGRAALLLLRLSRTARRRLDVMELFLAAPLDWQALLPTPDGEDGAEAARAQPSAWDRLTRMAMIAGGAAQWRERLARLRSEFERQLAGDVEGELTGTLHADIANLDTLRGAVTILFNRLDEIESCRTWQESVVWFQALIADLIAESGAKDKLLEVIEALNQLSPLQPETGPEAFRAAASAAIARANLLTGHFGEGVFAGDLTNARGLSFQVVCLLGAGEGVFPAASRRDPILDGREREVLNGLGPGHVLTPGDESGAEELSFQSLLHAARERLVLCYPYMGAEGRERLPSYFLLRAGEVLTGKQLDGQSLARTPGYRRVPASRLAPDDPGDALTPPEYDLAQVYRALAMAGSVIDPATVPVSRRLSYLDVLSPGFARARRVVTAHQEGQRFSRFDGVFTQDAAISALALQFGAGHGRLSPTALELYAACPRRYFFSRVLHLSPLDEPEEIERLQAGPRGNLIHTIFERFYRGLASENELPLRQDETERYRGRIHKEAEAAFAETHARGITGVPLLWEIEQTTIVEDLDEWLQRELQSVDGWIPFLFEAAFGMPSPPGGVALPPAVFDLGGGRILLFRGIVDRIERDLDAHRFRVVDYKTGRRPDRVSIDNLLRGGKALQLPVYLLAAAGVDGIPAGSQGTAEYHYATRRGEFRQIRFQQSAFEARRDDLIRILSTIADGIGAGVFFPNPGTRKTNCSFCDFTSICDGRVDSLFERKRADPRAAAVLALQEIP